MRASIEKPAEVPAPRCAHAEPPGVHLGPGAPAPLLPFSKSLRFGVVLNLLKTRMQSYIFIVVKSIWPHVANSGKFETLAELVKIRSFSQRKSSHFG